MTDPTADSTESTPQVLTTTTAAAPTTPPWIDTTAESAAPSPEGDTGGPSGPFGPDVPVGSEDGGPTEPTPSGYTPDFAALQAANGEPAVFGHEMHELIGHLTGKWIDEETITGWFALLSTQVQARAAREIVFRIANTEVPSQATGDPALNLLDFRDELARDLRKAVGLS